MWEMDWAALFCALVEARVRNFDGEAFLEPVVVRDLPPHSRYAPGFGGAYSGGIPLLFASLPWAVDGECPSELLSRPSLLQQVNVNDAMARARADSAPSHSQHRDAVASFAHLDSADDMDSEEEEDDEYEYEGEWFVEDDNDIADLIRVNLHELGIHTEHESDGKKALDNALDAVTLSASAENQILDKNNVAYPKYSVSPDLNSWFTSALANSDSSPQIDFTIDIQQILANQKAGQFTDVTDAAFISSLATKDSTNLLTNMKLTFQAQQAAVFTFNPSSWLDEDFISTYASTNGSTYEINPNSSLSNKDLFGKSGIINQRTAQVLVVYKSKVQLTGSSSDIQSLQKTFSTQKNVMVAGNTFSQNQISYENTTATFESNDNTPEVIGVIVKKYGNLN